MPLDGLTGLPGPKDFRARLEAGLGTGTPPRGALVQLDLDHFKRWLDTHGLSGGDGLLKAIAQSLPGACPPEAEVFRIGGEKFAAWLPDADLVDALAAAERMRRAAARQRVSVEALMGLGYPERIAQAAAEVGVTASAAVTVALAGDGAHEAARRTDHAMALAKSGGRDQTRVVIDWPAAPLVWTRNDGECVPLFEGARFHPVVLRHWTPAREGEGLCGQVTVPLPDGPDLVLRWRNFEREGQLERLVSFRLGDRPLVVEASFIAITVRNSGTTTMSVQTPPGWVGAAGALVDAALAGSLVPEIGQTPGTWRFESGQVASGAIYNTVVYTSLTFRAAIDAAAGSLRLVASDYEDTST